jgi:hypothetical protein
MKAGKLNKKDQQIKGTNNRRTEAEIERDRK